MTYKFKEFVEQSRSYRLEAIVCFTVAAAAILALATLILL
jgi:hypothetical protein